MSNPEAVRCHVCPRRCLLSQGETGTCRARICRDGKSVSLNYGKITSAALDPVEKKPLARFFPGSMIFSIGSFGCNLQCSFCQNHRISMAGIDNVPFRDMSPQAVADTAYALSAEGNIGVAFTYNEPLISPEFLLDTAQLVRMHQQKVVVVTNGYVMPELLSQILPCVDAMNIDLKAFSNGFYRRIDGDLERIKQTIISAQSTCHVEVTTLLIPGENDSEEEISALVDWLADLNPEIPLHLSRFFPAYRCIEKDPTPVSRVHELTNLARKRLRYVYAGNC